MRFMKGSRYSGCLILVLALLTVMETGRLKAASLSDLVRLQDMPLSDIVTNLVVTDVNVNGQAYVFGGSTQSSGYSEFSNTIRCFDAIQGQWSVLPSTLPYNYSSDENHNAAIASNGKVYLSPGNGPGGEGSHNRIIEFDPTTGNAIERAAITDDGSAIWGIAMAPAPATKGGVYLIGGWNGGGLSEIRHYDPDQDLVETVAYLTVGRTVGVRQAHPNGKIYLFGSNVGDFSVVEVFDPADETVRRIQNPQGFL